MTLAHAVLLALVRGMQIACFLTWSGAVMIRGGSLWQVIVNRDDSRWHRQWSSITWFGITQAAFCIRWFVFGGSMEGMGNDELAWWAVLYVSSTLSAIGVVIEHGWWTQTRHRHAMMLHGVVVGLCVLAAEVTS